jgi:hypothetical protein
MGDIDRRALAAAVVAGLAACVDPQASNDSPPAAPEDPAVATTDPHVPPPAADAIPPDLLDALRSDLAARSGVAAGDIRVVSARAMRWNDSSLGCPQPGQFYLQVIVDGYRVILEAQGREYDYRTNARGRITLCEQPSPDPGGRPRDVS